MDLIRSRMFFDGKGRSKNWRCNRQEFMCWREIGFLTFELVIPVCIFQPRRLSRAAPRVVLHSPPHASQNIVGIHTGSRQWNERSWACDTSRLMSETSKNLFSSILTFSG